MAGRPQGLQLTAREPATPSPRALSPTGSSGSPGGAPSRPPLDGELRANPAGNVPASRRAVRAPSHVYFSEAVLCRLSRSVRSCNELRIEARARCFPFPESALSPRTTDAKRRARRSCRGRCGARCRPMVRRSAQLLPGTLAWPGVAKLPRMQSVTVDLLPKGIFYLM